MLRELEKGEEALVLKPYSVTSRYKVGDIGTFSNIEDRYCVLDVGGEPRACVKRRDLLAIGDKVVRGPDFGRDYDFGKGAPKPSDVGTVKGFSKNTTANNESWHGSTISVQWDGGRYSLCYRMNAEYQDLKPTGESEDVEAPDDNPECFGDRETGKNCKGRVCPSCEHFKQECECKTVTHDASCPHRMECCKVKVTTYKHPGGDTITITESKEDIMTREQRAVEKDEKITNIEKQIEHDTIAHKESIAQKNESITELTEQAANLRKYKTDKAETVAQIVSVRKCTKKQAEDWLALRDKEIKV